VRVLAAGLLTATLVGCGMDHVTSVDARAYTALAQQISTSASAYAAAAGSTSDVPSCQSRHAAYDGQMMPMLERMHAMSGDMDREMGMMGPYGDMMCGADAMLAELAHHDAVACASTDMNANHAEATRHADAMQAWAEHQRASCAQMGGMMGSGGGSSTATCHRNEDGTFTLGP
jgi:hypothetical protein